MSKIVEFKSKQTRFKEWLEEVNELNFKDKEIESAMIIWETKDKNGESIANHVHLNCDLSNRKWFHRCLGENIKELEFDEYLRKHLNEYIEFINE